MDQQLWVIKQFNNEIYKILNPLTWEDLSYGIHNNCLTINENTRVKKGGEEKEIKPSLLSLFID